MLNSWAYYLRNNWAPYLPNALKPSSISHRPQSKDAPAVPTQAARTPSSDSIQQVSTNPVGSENVGKELQNASTSSSASTYQASTIPADAANTGEGLQATGTPSTSAQQGSANSTDPGTTREGLLAERAGEVERGQPMPHGHEESPTDLVKDISQTINQQKEEPSIIQVSFPDQDTHDRGNVAVLDSLPGSRACGQEGSPKNLSQDFNQKESQLEESSSTDQSSFLGQATHDQGGATTPDSLPGQSESPRLPCPKSGLLTSSLSQLNVSYLVPQVRNPTYSIFPPFRIDKVISARRSR